MSRKRFDAMQCSIAQSLEAFGDWWSLLIIRDAFFGIRRFSDFQQNLGIAKNILSARLEHLTAHGILVRVDRGHEGQRHEYELTSKGQALLPVLTAMRDWSDTWVFGKGNEPIVVTDRQSGKRIPHLKVLSADGRTLRSADLKSRPGPGADAEVLKFFDLASRAQTGL